MSDAERLDEVLPTWVATLEFEDLPESVVTASKRLLLDVLAVAWAGSAASGVESVLDLIFRQGGSPESSVWTDGGRVPAASAALANGLLAAALDFDSVHDEATIHPDIVMVPALLALAERGGASGRDFIVAHAAGNEMAVRLGLAVTEHPGWFYSSVLGVPAAAAASARLLRLGVAGVRAATGVSLSRAAGSQQSLLEGSFTKRLQTAFAARDGVEAALLAQCGISAPRHPFAGRAGLDGLYVHLDAEKALSGLGRDFRFTTLTIKNFPSCFCNHAAILAAQQLTRGGTFRADEIASCKVTLTPSSARLVGAPFAPGDNPQVAAQFSAQYSVANVLLRGGLDVSDIAPHSVLDPDVVGLASRIEVVADDDWAARFTPSIVELRLANGVARKAVVDVIPGTPAMPLTATALRHKAAACFSSGVRPLPAPHLEQLMARIERLESLDSLSDLWNFDGR